MLSNYIVKRRLNNKLDIKSMHGKGVLITYEDGTQIKAHSFYIRKISKTGKVKTLVLLEQGNSKYAIEYAETVIWDVYSQS